MPCTTHHAPRTAHRAPTTGTHATALISFCLGRRRALNLIHQQSSSSASSPSLESPNEEQSDVAVGQTAFSDAKYWASKASPKASQRQSATSTSSTSIAIATEAAVATAAPSPPSSSQGENEESDDSGGGGGGGGGSGHDAAIEAAIRAASPASGLEKVALVLCQDEGRTSAHEKARSTVAFVTLRSLSAVSTLIANEHRIYPFKDSQPNNTATATGTGSSSVGMAHRDDADGKFPCIPVEPDPEVCVAALVGASVCMAPSEQEVIWPSLRMPRRERAFRALAAGVAYVLLGILWTPFVASVTIIGTNIELKSTSPSSLPGFAFVYNLFVKYLPSAIQLGLLCLIPVVAQVPFRTSIRIRMN